MGSLDFGAILKGGFYLDINGTITTANTGESIIFGRTIMNNIFRFQDIKVISEYPLFWTNTEQI